MKAFNLIFILLFASNTLWGQKLVFYSENLETYEGTWMYQSNDTIFKIVLQKAQKIERDYTIDGLLGGYFLSVKGITIEDYMSPIPASWGSTNSNNLYIWATNAAIHKNQVTPNSLRFIFWDQKKRHFDGDGIMAGTIKFLSPNKIQWILDEKEGIRAKIDIIADPIGFSVPTDVIMTKVQ